MSHTLRDGVLTINNVNGTLAYQHREYPACCQAGVVAYLECHLPQGSVKEVKLSTTARAQLVAGMSLEYHAATAVTTSNQKIWAMVLKDLRFEPVFKWHACTGSDLTFWAYNPGDQEDDSDDDDYDDYDNPYDDEEF